MNCQAFLLLGDNLPGMSKSIGGGGGVGRGMRNTAKFA